MILEGNKNIDCFVGRCGDLLAMTLFSSALRNDTKLSNSSELAVPERRCVRTFAVFTSSFKVLSSSETKWACFTFSS